MTAPQVTSAATAFAVEDVASDVETGLTTLVDQMGILFGQVLESAGRTIDALLRDDRIDWYDHDEVTEKMGTLTEVMRPHEIIAARNMDALIARALTETTGSTHQPVGIRNNPLGRPGATHEEVFGRLANQFRWQQAKTDKMMLTAARTGRLPTALVDPQDAVIDRANRQVQTNLQLTANRQASLAFDASRFVTGYRRIIHPELATEGTCGLCIAASDRKYHKRELLPIHPGCHCTVLPITDAFDPHSLNEIDFRTIYRDSGGTKAEELRGTRYRIDQNGEIGPVIRPEGEPIRSKRKVANVRPHEAAPDPVRVLTDKRQALVDSLGVLQGQRAQFPDRYSSGRWDEIEGKMLARIEKLKAALGEFR